MLSSFLHAYRSLAWPITSPLEPRSDSALPGFLILGLTWELPMPDGIGEWLLAIALAFTLGAMAGASF